MVKLTVSFSHPDLLIAVDANGAVFVWDVPARALRFEWPQTFRFTYRSKDLGVRDGFCEAETALLQLRNRLLMTMHLPDFGTLFPPA